MRIRSVQTEVKTMKLSEEGVAPREATVWGWVVVSWSLCDGGLEEGEGKGEEGGDVLCAVRPRTMRAKRAWMARRTMIIRSSMLACWCVVIAGCVLVVSECSEVWVKGAGCVDVDGRREEV